MAGLYGGAEKVLEILISQADLSTKIAFAFLTDGPLVHLAHDRGLPCRLIQRKHFSNPFDTIRVIAQLRRYIGEVRATTVLAWTDMAQLYAAPACWGLSKSVWWQQANVDPGMMARICKWFPSSGAIANSCFIRDQLQQRGVRVSEEPLYPPFEEAKFARIEDRMTLRKALGLPLDRRIIGSVGRMQSWKGFGTIVAALAEVRIRHPDAMGLIVGSKHDLEPDYEGQLRRQIENLGLSDHVILPGAQRDVARWMGAMDIFIHAAEREPFGIVVPEAMSLGLPVIASIPGGPAEAIEHGKSGLLVKAGAVEELACSVTKIFQDEGFARILGASASAAASKFQSAGFLSRLTAKVGSLK